MFALTEVSLRKERDSNPRYSYPYTAFRVRPIRPLWHLSKSDAKVNKIIDSKQGEIRKFKNIFHYLCSLHIIPFITCNELHRTYYWRSHLSNHRRISPHCYQSRIPLRHHMLVDVCLSRHPFHYSFALGRFVYLVHPIRCGSLFIILEHIRTV